MKIIIFTILLLILNNIHAQEIPQTTDSIKIVRDANYGLSIATRLSDEKYGVLDSDGKVVVDFEYDHISPYYDKRALVYKNEKCGYLNLQGQIEIPIDYVLGNNFKNGKAVVSKNFINGVIDTAHNIVIPFKYNALITHDHTSYHFQLEPKKSGLMDSQEKVIKEPGLFRVFVRQNDSLWIGTKDGQFFIFKNNGDLHNENQYDNIGSKNSANLMRMKRDGQVGFLDDQYKEAIPPQYEDSGMAFSDFVSVYDGENWGFIDKTNTSKHGLIYEKVMALHTDKAIVRKNGKSNILDSKGDYLLEEDCKSIQSIANTNLIYIDSHIYDSELNKITAEKVRTVYGANNGLKNGRFKIIVNDKLGYMDTLGNMAVQAIYDEGDHFYEDNCTAVSVDGEWGFIKNDGSLMTPIEFDTVMHFGTYWSYEKCNYLIGEDNLIGCYMGDKIVFEPQFEELILHDEDRLVYRKGNKYGIIDSAFVIHEELYDTIQSTRLGYQVVQDGKHGFLDKNLNVVIPIKYEYLFHFGYYLIAKLNGKYGTITETNEIIEDFVFDDIANKDYEMWRTYKNGKVGTLGMMGKELIPAIYDSIKKLDWKNVEVTKGSETKVINTENLELENAEKIKK